MNVVVLVFVLIILSQATESEDIECECFPNGLFRCSRSDVSVMKDLSSDYGIAMGCRCTSVAIIGDDEIIIYIDDQVGGIKALGVRQQDIFLPSNHDVSYIEKSEL
jgi:hypothetical protein